MKTIAKGEGTDWQLLAGLRFILAWIVLCYHINERFAAVPGAVPWVIRLFAECGGKAAVAGFFLVSGYSIAASLKRHPADYYKRRFWRIYPLYLAAITLTLLLEAGFGRHLAMPDGSTLTALSPLVGLGNALFLQTFLVPSMIFDIAVWSLAVEVSYYMVAPLLPRLPRWTLPAVIAISALSYIAPRHGDWGPLYYVFTRFNMLEWAWTWFVGYYLFSNARPLVVAAVAVIGSLLIWGNDWMNPEPYAVMTFLGSLLTLLVARRGSAWRRTTPMLGKALGWLGDVSYPLYLFQFPILLGAWGLFGISNAAALIVACLGGAIGAYYAVDVWLKTRLEQMIEELAPGVA
jgi:peptidoglycan/LPS O-acetylase OafA/YrhL